jgi:hypothetical protein
LYIGQPIINQSFESCRGIAHTLPDRGIDESA